MRKLNINNEKRLPLWGGRLVLMITIAIVIVVAILFCKGLWAKYVSQEEKEPLYIAENFYFESDYLVEPSSGENGSYTFMEGENSIEIVLRNYTDDLRYSEVDIEYKVTLEGLDIAKQTQEGTLEKDAKSQDVITFSNLSAGTYTITAVATPYSKTLQGAFTIRDAVTDISYVVNDNEGSPFLEVVVTSKDYTGDIKFVLPSGVRPDNTDPLLKDTTTTDCKTTVNDYSSYTFLFFKDDPKTVYNDTQIKVEKVATTD